MRLVSIEQGSDWTDAGYDILDVPDEMDLMVMEEEWRVWYNEKYLPAYKDKTKTLIPYVEFVEFLKQRGAREAKVERAVFCSF
jgi:hypothetical protein